MNETTIRIQDDLYMAVNGKWLETAVIPEDRPTTGGFSDLDQAVEKLMMEEFKTAMMLTGCSNVEELSDADYVVVGETRQWID